MAAVSLKSCLLLVILAVWSFGGTRAMHGLAVAGAHHAVLAQPLLVHGPTTHAGLLTGVPPPPHHPPPPYQPPAPPVPPPHLPGHPVHPGHPGHPGHHQHGLQHQSQGATPAAAHAHHGGHHHHPPHHQHPSAPAHNPFSSLLNACAAAVCKSACISCSTACCLVSTAAGTVPAAVFYLHSANHDHSSLESTGAEQDAHDLQGWMARNPLKVVVLVTMCGQLVAHGVRGQLVVPLKALKKKGFLSWGEQDEGGFGSVGSVGPAHSVAAFADLETVLAGAIDRASDEDDNRQLLMLQVLRSYVPPSCDGVHGEDGTTDHIFYMTRSVWDATVEEVLQEAGRSLLRIEEPEEETFRRTAAEIWNNCLFVSELSPDVGSEVYDETYDCIGVPTGVYNKRAYDGYVSLGGSPDSASVGAPGVDPDVEENAAHSSSYGEDDAPIERPGSGQRSSSLLQQLRSWVLSGKKEGTNHNGHGGRHAVINPLDLRNLHETTLPVDKVELLAGCQKVGSAEVFQVCPCREPEARLPPTAEEQQHHDQQEQAPAAQGEGQAPLY